MFAVCKSFIALAIVVAGAFAQTTSSYTDSATGITFQKFTDKTTGYSFGAALPQSPGSDFIGQIAVPFNGTGWAGVSLGGNMANSILIVAWTNGKTVMSSLRETTGYVSPDVYSGNATLTAIPSGTFVNSTAMSYTFLCQGCLTGDSQSFNATSSTAVLGWAAGGQNPKEITDSATPLAYHGKGFGNFGLLAIEAQSANYLKFAQMATGSAANLSASGSSSSPCQGSGSKSSSPFTRKTPSKSTSKVPSAVAIPNPPASSPALPAGLSAETTSAKMEDDSSKIDALVGLLKRLLNSLSGRNKKDAAAKARRHARDVMGTRLDRIGVTL
ncbi:MAG: hypothetical protein Q9227_005755 [Pyrenula ochraceoflavens]